MFDVDHFEVPEEFDGEDLLPVPFPAPSAVPAAERTTERPVPSRVPHPSRPEGDGVPRFPPLFAWLARRFAPGQLTLWVGARAALDPVLEMLYAGNALGRGRISLLEGANHFNPYRLGEVGRGLGVDAAEVLRHIRLARSFTGYQMVALVDAWSAEVPVGTRPPSSSATTFRPPLDRRYPRGRAGGAAPPRRGIPPHARRVDPDPAPPDARPARTARFPGLDEAGPPWCDLVTFSRGPVALRLRALRTTPGSRSCPAPPASAGSKSSAAAPPGR